MSITDRIFYTVYKRIKKYIDEEEINLSSINIEEIRENDIILVPSSYSVDEYMKVSDFILEKSDAALVILGDGVDIIRIGGK